MALSGIEAAAVPFSLAIGRGAPVVAVHGGTSLDHIYFRPWLEALAVHCELNYVDLRGGGQSAALSSDESFLDAWTADIDEEPEAFAAVVGRWLEQEH